MKAKPQSQQLYAAGLLSGACILIYRCCSMLLNGVVGILVPLVASTIVLELICDVTCAVFCIGWLYSKDSSNYCSNCALVWGARCAVLHAFRVAIFAIGRIPNTPLTDFDVREDQRRDHSTRWNWNQVCFASTLSICGLIVTWWIRQKRMLQSNRRHARPAPVGRDFQGTYECRPAGHQLSWAMYF